MFKLFFKEYDINNQHMNLDNGDNQQSLYVTL